MEKNQQDRSPEENLRNPASDLQNREARRLADDV